MSESEVYREAIAEMGSATDGHGSWEYHYSKGLQSIERAECECGESLALDGDDSAQAAFQAHRDELKLAALLAPSRIPCPTCGGTRFTIASLCREVAERARPDPNFDGPEPCTDCSEGMVDGPSLAMELLGLEEIDFYEHEAMMRGRCAVPVYRLVEEGNPE